MQGHNQTLADRVSSLPMFHRARAELIDELAADFREQSFESGQMLWREGEVARSFLFIGSGSVRITKLKPDGSEVLLGVFTKGDPVGEVPAFNGEPYPGSAYALAETHCLTIDREAFLQHLEARPELVRAVMSALAGRLNYLVRRIDQLTTKGVERRIAIVFTMFAKHCGEPSDEGLLVRIPLSRADIASLVNTRIETAIRVMSAWNKSGPIRTLHDGFLIVDTDELKRLAESPT